MTHLEESEVPYDLAELCKARGFSTIILVKDPEIICDPECLQPIIGGDHSHLDTCIRVQNPLIWTNEDMGGLQTFFGQTLANISGHWVQLRHAPHAPTSCAEWAPEEKTVTDHR